MGRPRKSDEYPPPKVDKKGRLLLEKPPEYGPAMKALTPRRQKFCELYASYGYRHAARAFLNCGYMGDQETLSANAHRLLRDQKIIAALQELGRADAEADAPANLEHAKMIRDDPTSSKKDQLAALKFLADRTGFHARTEHKVTTEIVMDRETMIKQLQAAQAVFGGNLVQMIPESQFALPKPDAPVEDAEFEEIDPDLADLF